MTDLSEDHAAIQGDLDELERWTDKNPMKFNKEKYKGLYLVRRTAGTSIWLGVTQVESKLAEKDLWVLVNTKFNMSQQWAFAAKKSMYT